MKVLRLTNSSDVDPRLPEEERAPWRAARVLREAIGEPVELTVKTIWPTERLLKLVDGWLDECEPDMVVLCVNSFWYTYPSVPLRLRRRFGRAGSAAATAGLKLGGTKFVARSPAYHLARRLLTRSVGAETHFTPDQSVAAIEGCLRRIVAREHVIPVVRCGITAHGADVGGRWARFALARWAEVDARLQALCESLHVEYIALEQAKLPTPQEYSSDVVHPNAEGHAWRAQWEAAGLVRAWGRVHRGDAVRAGS